MQKRNKHRGKPSLQEIPSSYKRKGEGLYSKLEFVGVSTKTHWYHPTKGWRKNRQDSPMGRYIYAHLMGKVS